MSNPKSMDDLPDVEHTFRYCADFAEALVPAPAEFCRACGASIPHRPGEGRCPKCIHHDPDWRPSK